MDKPMKMNKMEPTFTIDEEMLPEIKDWKVGKRYTITMEVEQVGLSKGDGMMAGPMEPGQKPPKTVEARFRVISAMAGDESEEPSEEEMLRDTGEMVPGHKAKMNRMHDRYGAMDEEE